MELSRTEKNRKKILKAAYELMCKKGVAQTSINEVAKKSKTSHPLVTYHFPNIDQLYVGVLKEVLEEMREVTIKAVEVNAASPSKMLKDYCEVLFHWAVEHEDKIKLFMYFYYLASVDSQFREMNDSIRKIGRERVENILVKGMAFGDFQKRSPEQTRALATFIQGVVTGNLLMAVSENTLPLKEAAVVTSQHVDALVLK